MARWGGIRRLLADHAAPQAGWEVASHGYRWIDYQDVPEEVRRPFPQERGMRQREPTGCARRWSASTSGVRWRCTSV